MNNREVYIDAINIYGQEKQVDIMIEEMSELTRPSLSTEGSRPTKHSKIYKKKLRT